MGIKLSYNVTNLNSMRPVEQLELNGFYAEIIIFSLNMKDSVEQLQIEISKSYREINGLC